MSVSPDDRSFLDRLAGVFGSGGALGANGPNSQGLSDLGMSLLANSGYSTTPRTFGQILGTSALQSQQMASQRQNDAIKNMYMQAQARALLAKPTMPTPSSVAEYEYAKAHGFTGSFEEWQTKARSQGSPADVASYEFYSKLTPEQKKEFLSLKRNVGSDFQIVDVNGVPTVVYKPGVGTQSPFTPVTAPPSTPPLDQPTAAPPKASVPAVPPSATPPPSTGTPFTTPLSTTGSEADAARRIAEARASGEAAGKAKGAAEFDLPRVEQNVNQAIADIEKLKKHPGLEYITGVSSKLPIIPGTSQAAADALAKQVQGQTFLQAYQQLRGGGAITEVEGAKGEAAVGRLIRSQSTEDYKSALDELEGILKDGLARTRKQAGVSPQQSRAPQAALDYLKSHPEAADQFKSKYGYLP